MAKEFDPGTTLQPSQPMFRSLNYAVPTARNFNVGLQDTSSLVCPPYTNPQSCLLSGNGFTPCTEFQADKPFLNASASVSPFVLSHGGSQFVSPTKRLLEFDQTGGQMNLIPSSLINTYPYMISANQFYVPGIPYIHANSVTPGTNLQNNNEAYGSNRNAGEEMHENTDEIDDLLYSDTDEEYEEASTGHSPIETIAPCSSEVASSVLPAKRKRVNVDDPDSSVIDTASSEVSSHQEVPVAGKNAYCGDDELDCVSSCSKGGNYNQTFSRKRLRRAKIHETVSVLRRIIPGGRRKDTTTILDEAIHYLKALKVKAKTFGSSPV